LGDLAKILEISKYVATIMGSVTLWKLFEFFYPDVRDYFLSRIKAKEVFNKNLDPILKASNELLGKITSMSRNDFDILREEEIDENEIMYILYLFANFWSRLTILKIESDFTALARIKKGEELLIFISALEARRNRIIDRYKQRMIGEAIIDKASSPLKPLTMFEFFQLYKEDDSPIKEYFEDLKLAVKEAKHRANRQQILLYGMIVHSIIEHFDPKHKLIRKRNPYVNKLSEKTKEELEKRVFGNFLPFVKKPSKFYK